MNDFIVIRLLLVAIILVQTRSFLIHSVSNHHAYKSNVALHSSSGGGFKVIKPVVLSKRQSKQQQLNQVNIGEELCPCSSGLTYGSCCQLLHEHMSYKKAPGVSAESILRARYTAYKLGVADYIIDTSHETSEDYIKFNEESQATTKSSNKRWKKEVLQMTKELTFLHFDIVSQHIGKDNNSMNIIFNAVFKENDTNDVVGVIENSTFIKTVNHDNVVIWKYQDGITDFIEEEKLKYIIENNIKLPNNNDSSSSSSSNNSNNGSDNVTADSKSSPSKKGSKKLFISPVRTENGKLGSFQKSKVNYIPRGTSSS